jgi:hypothetical protein
MAEVAALASAGNGLGGEPQMLVAGGARADYPTAWPVAARLLGAVLFHQNRLFRTDALACVSRLRPPLQVLGAEHLPLGGPCLITVNHFSRAGFRAWWIPVAISAVVPADIHWVMTRTWRFDNWGWSRAWLVPAFGWLLRRVAGVYGFTAMPAMPPDPAEATDRALAVRAVLALARRAPRPIIGLAPEGRDSPLGCLAWPPAGVGRMVEHLATAGLTLLPAAVYEAVGRLCVRFGPAYSLDQASAPKLADRDRQVTWVVMHHIAAQLPSDLRGEFT